MTYWRDAIDRMDGYVPGEQPRDRCYIKLNTNENPYPPAPAVADLLANWSAESLRLYPDPVATELRTVGGNLFGLPADWVLAGNGSDDLLTIAVRTFVDQGGTLACFDPTYSLYATLADIQGATTRLIPLDDQFGMPADTAEQAAGASLLFVTRPNAPTGNAFDRDRVRELCAAFDGIVLIDEAYADFADDHCVELVREFPNVVVSRTLSKSYSLAGIRLGLAFAQPELIGQMMKVKDSYNLNMLTQAIGIAALKDQQHMQANVARVRATRERVTKSLRGMGFEVLPSDTNFLFAAPPVPAEGVLQGLRERGLLVRYFRGDRTGRFLRITVGTDQEMDAFEAAVADILKG